MVKQAEPFTSIQELEETNYLLGAQAGTMYQSMFEVVNTFYDCNLVLFMIKGKS